MTPAKAVQAEFAWGDELTPGGRHMANIWQGDFPIENLATDGYERTSPVRAFSSNGYGLFDMIGNVWEWTTDWYSTRHTGDAPKACCIPENPRGGPETGSYDACQQQAPIPRKVVKGGSHICARNYCRRHRPAARQVGVACFYPGRPSSQHWLLDRLRSEPRRPSNKRRHLAAGRPTSS
jgi:sulfatase modifying factor 1